MAAKDEDYLSEYSDELDEDTQELEHEVEKKQKSSKKKKKSAPRVEEYDYTEEVKKISVAWAVAASAVFFLIGFVMGGVVLQQPAQQTIDPAFLNQAGSAPALSADQASAGLPSGHPTIPSDSGTGTGTADTGAVDPASAPDLSAGEPLDNGQVPNP